MPDPVTDPVTDPGPEPVTDRSWARAADRMGTDAVRRGEPLAWFEALWSAAERDEIDTPWERDAPYPLLPALVEAAGALDGEGRRAVVIGAGLGADAEFVAGLGYDTVAFDVSPAAVRTATARHPGSAVSYRVADLLALPAELRGVFDLVVEVFTVQAMPSSLRDDAVAGVRSLLAVDGQALIVQFVRADGEPVTDEPPWMLDRAELNGFAAPGYDLVDVAARESPRGPTSRPLWTARLHRRR